MGLQELARFHVVPLINTAHNQDPDCLTCTARGLVLEYRMAMVHDHITPSYLRLSFLVGASKPISRHIAASRQDCLSDGTACTNETERDIDPQFVDGVVLEWRHILQLPSSLKRPPPRPPLSYYASLLKVRTSRSSCTGTLGEPCPQSEASSTAGRTSSSLTLRTSKTDGARRRMARRRGMECTAD